MMSSPELERELRATRPVAPPSLRERVRELAVAEPARPALPSWGRLRLPVRRVALVAVPAALALAFASAGVIGLVSSRNVLRDLYSDAASSVMAAPGSGTTATETLDSAALPQGANDQGTRAGALSGTLGPGSPTAAPDRAQRVSATLALEVADSDAVSRAAQETLALTRRLGGYVVSSSVTTGEQGNAQLTVRVPADRVQEAIVGLSGLGRIVSQNVAIDDLQAGVDSSQRRIRSLRAQIALITARLESETLDTETRAKLEARLKTLRTELRVHRRTVSALRAEARMATVAVTVATPDAFGGVVPASRLDRTLDEALNVLAWEAVIALAVLIVLAPFVLLAAGVWLGRRLYRQREEERLLAT